MSSEPARPPSPAVTPASAGAARGRDCLAGSQVTIKTRGKVAYDRFLQVTTVAVTAHAAFSGGRGAVTSVRVAVCAPAPWRWAVAAFASCALPASVSQSSAPSSLTPRPEPCVITLLLLP